jgi:hypothetical protein
MRLPAPSIARSVPEPELGVDVKTTAGKVTVPVNVGEAKLAFSAKFVMVAYVLAAVDDKR